MHHFIKASVILFLGLALTVTLSSCEEDEDNKVAKAQKCLNELTDASTDPAIQNCIDQVNGIESEAAYTIRCSASFLMGGLTTAKIVTAFKDFDAASADEKEATLIDNLALTSTTDADAAYEYCAKTNTPGLMYIAALCRVGTIIKTQGTGASIEQQIQDCADNPSSCDMEAIAESAVTLADLYCKGDSADEQVCLDIETAQTNAGGDLEQLAVLLLQQFNN